MKSRQKLSVSEKNLTSRELSDINSSALDTRIRKKIPTNPLVQKNISFLQTYNNLFKKFSNFNIDNTQDRYFRSSLRNEPFDLIRELNLSSLVRRSKSLDTVYQTRNRKPRSKRTLLSPKGAVDFTPKSEITDHKFEEEEPRLRDIYVPKIKDADWESAEENEYFEAETYFSPKNDFQSVLEKVNESVEETKAEFDSDREETPKSSEGEAEKEELRIEEEICVDSGYLRPELETKSIKSQDTTMGEDNEMQEVEKMIAMASKELDGVAKENKKMLDDLDKGSTFKFNAKADANILRELDEAECEANQTSEIIARLKDRVMELTKKQKMTEVEAKELEELNIELKNQMILFEQKTKKIQELLKNENLFSDPGGFQPSQYDEDVLPKVVVCGLTENCMPKLLICDDTKSKCAKKFAPGRPRSGKSKKRKGGPCFPCPPPACPPPCPPMCPPPSPPICPPPCPPICPPPCPPIFPPPCPPQPCSPGRPCPGPPCRMPCGPGRGTCPADIEARLQEYSENTRMLECQLYNMEAEVREMHKELLAVQKEREHLEHHRKMLCPASPCVMPPPCPGSGPCGPPCMPPTCMPPPPCMAPPPCVERPGCETQLRELREQYKRLQDDFKSKLTEVAGLRAENEKLKEKTKLAEEAKKEAEKKMRELDMEVKRLKGSLKQRDAGASKEQMIELENQLAVAKKRFRESQDELDELRLLVDDQQKQLDDYRSKYLEAQQTVEEQRRQIDLMEMENQRTSEQVNLEIQRVKNQFQEKLQELMPLPDILKSTQMKLQEAQQMHLLAERNNEAIGRELEMYKDKVAAMAGQMEEVKSDNALGADATAALEEHIQDLEEQLAQLSEMNNNLLNDMEKLHESCEEYEKLAEERLHEITQLEAQLDGLREETGRQVARIKDRCEIVRRSMQKQIGDLERQLAQSRAMAKSAQKDRDEIRQKMQAQINNLNENFEDAQMRIRNLQGHVNFMKNTYGDGMLDIQRPGLPEPCECDVGY